MMIDTGRSAAYKQSGIKIYHTNSLSPKKAMSLIFSRRMAEPDSNFQPSKIQSSALIFQHIAS